MDTHGLQLLDISTRRWRHFEYPHTMTSSLLPAKRDHSGGRCGLWYSIVEPGRGIRPISQPNMSALTVHAFDQGKSSLFSRLAETASCCWSGPPCRSSSQYVPRTPRNSLPIAPRSFVHHLKTAWQFIVLKEWVKVMQLWRSS
jgi:hypothetical protein